MVRNLAAKLQKPKIEAENMVGTRSTDARNPVLKLIQIPNLEIVTNKGMKSTLSGKHSSNIVPAEATT